MASALLVFAMAVPVASACKPGSLPLHVIDAQAQVSDTTPPGPVTVTVSEISRGKGPDTNWASCSQSASSCDDIGTVTLQVSAEDDQSPPDKLGYQLQLADGQLPSGLTLPTDAVRTLAGALYLYWNDGASDDQEAISFSLAIRAVDLAGHLGPASTVVIHDPGSGGCSLPARRPNAPWPLVAVTILIVVRWTRRLACRA
jgi:hypothetical protein